MALDKKSAARKRREKVDSFDIPGALRLSREILARPTEATDPRPEPVGELVFEFVAPLALCPTTNSLIGMARGRGDGRTRTFSPYAQTTAIQERLFKMLQIQHPMPRSAPLPGRPFVRVLRFSSHEPDEAADGAKLVLDFLRPPKPPAWNERLHRLTKGRKGFGFIVDDAPKYVQIRHHWEKAPPGAGMMVVQVFTGQP